MHFVEEIASRQLETYKKLDDRNSNFFRIFCQNLRNNDFILVIDEKVLRDMEYLFSFSDHTLCRGNSRRYLGHKRKFCGQDDLEKTIKMNSSES